MLVLLLLSLAAGPDAGAGAVAADRATIDFSRDIRPLLQAHCYSCHGPDSQKSGLRLDVRKALEGGDNGPLLLPGKSAESELIKRVISADESERMPPKGDPLSAKEISLLRDWIEQGAVWPDDGQVDARPRSTHWSFQPPIDAAPPAVRDANWVRNPLDRFVLSTLEQRGIAPSPEADRSTLLRRLCLDLTGLSPSLEQQREYLADDLPGAYERLVERLLASAHFGERWGRHWLDLARYADSNGYERDDVRPNAWRYRDWVIEAFNADLPYDRFITEQLAGDLLPAATRSQQIATGFQRMTTKNTESGINKEDYRNREMVDRVNTTSAVFLGLTMGCAQCHSHKYDPISQLDYYRLYGFFDRAEETDIAIEGTPEELKIQAAALAAHEQKERGLGFRIGVLETLTKLGCDKWCESATKARQDAERQLAALETVLTLGPERWYREISPELRAALKLPADVEGVLATAESGRGETQQKVLAGYFDSLALRRAVLLLQVRPLREQLLELDQGDDWVAAVLAEPSQRSAQQTALLDGFQKELPARIDDLGQQIRQLSVEKRSLPRPAVMALTKTTGTERTTHILLRGDFKQQGPIVQPGVPAILPTLNVRGAPPDRLDLANWLTDPANPLTARVAVNQIWRHLFGRGLVATVDDFGTQGDRPSHPELLDWLSQEFHRNGWSRKHLIRLIVTSTAYRQSARCREDLRELDPLNILLARQSRFRVEGEIVRDLFLAAGGLLQSELGGPTIYPPVPDSIRDLAYKYKLVWETSAKPARYRRGMYIHFKRSNPYPTLVTFDCPESNVCTPARGRSNTPLQALVTLNDPVFVECAQALGKRILLASSGTIEERLRFAGRVCLARDLSPEEVNALMLFHAAEREAYAELPAAATAFVGEYQIAGHMPAETAAWIAVARALLNLDEFVTRE